jgi:predicted ArsR family transcriptional regulator
MSASRTRLLETLEAQTEPTTLAALVATTGLHANTVREHLEALERRGFVTRHRAEPVGRGRPAWLYESTTHGHDTGSPEYAGLAAALATAIHRSSSTPREDAIAAGEDWGRELARDHGRPARTGPAAARRQVVSMLDDIGFAPEPNAGHSLVRLTRCPLLEAAHKHPDIVCAVHLGLVRGALEEYGAEPHGVRLLPFAEPGACRLGMHLPEPEDQA